MNVSEKYQYSLVPLWSCMFIHIFQGVNNTTQKLALVTSVTLTTSNVKGIRKITSILTEKKTEIDKGSHNSDDHSSGSGLGEILFWLGHLLLKSITLSKQALKKVTIENKLQTSFVHLSYNLYRQALLPDPTRQFYTNMIIL